MRPEEILQNQRDLLERCDDEIFQRVMTGTVAPTYRTGTSATDVIESWTSSVSSRIGGDDGRKFISSDPRQEAFGGKQSTARAVSRHLKPLMQASYAYRVTPDMCTLVEFAASQLDESDLIHRSLAPTGCGFVHFERPLPVVDARGQLILLNWAAWGPSTNGTIVHWFNDYLISPDTYSQQIMEDDSAVNENGVKASSILFDAVGRWAFVSVTHMEDGGNVGPALVETDAEAAASILADGATPQPHTNADRYMMALWMLLGQTITDVREEHVRKTEVKRAKRMGMPGTVTVIALRRHEGSRHEGESLVEWSHRWVVRGHWRWQASGPGRTERNRIWVQSHVKGPEGMPLKQSEKLYDLRR